MGDRERNSIVRAKSHADQSIRERTLSATEALNGNQHLLITGEPGAGKSTLGYVYVQRLSRYWLEGQATQAPVDEPVLPLRIPARALARHDAWSELLAAGASEALGRLLATRPRPELFSQKNLGARWLVFVDGLDEIVSSATRDKVIQAIARQVRKGNDYRLVVTTRPLPGRQLEPLLSADMESFVMQPFGPDELDAFSAAWFRAQDPMTAPERAAQFAHQVQDGQLRELVRNPLLATIAAITYTRELATSVASLPGPS